MNSCYIIAEAGVNHNGSLEMAKQLIKVAAESGADAVKFQTFHSESLVSSNAAKAEYQKKLTSSSESQLQMLKKLELTEDMHRELITYASYCGVEFLSTPFDFISAELLTNTFDLPKIKVSSGDLTNAPLLLQIAHSGKPIIISTGMSTLGEIEQALGCIAFGYLQSADEPSVLGFRAAYSSVEGQDILKERVTLLHCTTEYPAPYQEVNLRNMITLRTAFDLPVGFSDHTEGISVSIAAAAMGATVIEKHFTLDKTLPGPDHTASLEPEELKTMIRSIRQVEEAMGSLVKQPTISEIKNKVVARKSLVAKHGIKSGERFTADNLTVKRPGHGVEPIHYWDWLSKTATRDYEEDDVIEQG